MSAPPGDGAITVADGRTVTLDIAASVGAALYQPGQTGQQLLPPPTP